MDSNKSELRCGVAQRLEFMEFRLFWEGRVNRSDLIEQFGLSVNQASADLNGYIGFTPENMVYDKSARTYIRGPAWECHEVCVSGPAHAVFRYGHALKRSSNIIANWLRAANHSRTFLPSFSKLRMAK